MLLPIAAPVNSIVVPLAPMEIIPYRIDAGGQPRYCFSSDPTLMFGNGLPAAGKMMRNRNRRPAAKPAKKLVFLKKLI